MKRSCIIIFTVLFLTALNSLAKPAMAGPNRIRNDQRVRITVIVDTLTVNETSDTLVLADSLKVDSLAANPDSIAAVVNGERPEVKKEEPAPVVKEEPKKEPKPNYWSRGGQTTLNFSQISLSNWTAGGSNSIAFNSLMNIFLHYKQPNNRLTWENTLDLGYGLINQEHRRTVKSNDRIDFSTKFGLRASDSWSYSSLINFRTQFAPGYHARNDTLKISNFMAPAYLNISVGMDHKFDENISFYFSPLAGRIVYVLDEDLSAQGAFGVEKGENRRNEFGGFIRAHFRATLMENITANSRLEIFSNYLDKPQNMSINLDTRINMRINQYITADLQIQMIYDENAIKRAQIKQVFGMGLTYRF